MRSIPYVLNHTGVCLEKEHKYKPSQWLLKPDDSDYASAAKYRAGAYHRITGGVEEMKAVLRSGYVFVAGITIYESFESAEVARTGIVPIPDFGRESLMGFHATLFHGFDDRKQRFKVRNSWGSDWGSYGDFYLPYNFVANPRLMRDAWIQHLGKPWVSNSK
jgi:C1A family cysteine protease